MTLLSRVKERTGATLSDSELQNMIDAIVGELARDLDPAGQITVELGDPGDPHSRLNRTLLLVRPMDTAEDVAIVERDPSNSGDASSAVTLDPTDYRVLHGGRTLQRLVSGPNGRSFWAPMVTVTYTPIGAASAQAVRDEAVVKLMMLDLSWRGLMKSESAGDYSWQGSLSADSYPKERQAIIDALKPGAGMMLA